VTSYGLYCIIIALLLMTKKFQAELAGDDGEERQVSLYLAGGMNMSDTIRTDQMRQRSIIGRHSTA
jgi:hypothetical protein